MTTTEPNLNVGDIVRRKDPTLNPRPYRVLRIHGEWAWSKPVDGGSAIDIPVELLERVEDLDH